MLKVENLKNNKSFNIRPIAKIKINILNYTTIPNSKITLHFIQWIKHEPL